MEKVNVRKQDEILMSLVHYFVTKEGYAPIYVQGVKDEIWLENIDGPYRIIRINSNYIHNEEQYKYDEVKIRNIMGQIKKKTLSFKVNTLTMSILAILLYSVLKNPILKKAEHLYNSFKLIYKSYYLCHFLHGNSRTNRQAQLLIR